MHPLLLLPLLVPGPRAGSAFDLTTAFPKPGSLGRLIRDGHNLRFENDPARTRRVLVGTNLTGMACFPASDSQANQWAQSLAKRGYNAVRLHHIDWVIRDKGWPIKANADRFISALKRQGIYVTIDLFSDRASNREEFKRGVISGNASVRNDWAAYARRLLREPSHAAGCAAWKDEPAIFGLCPVNEDDPRFLGISTKSYESAYKWMLGVVRNAGYRGLVWGLNSGIDVSMKSATDAFNVEDMHLYWDHPQGTRFLNTSGVRQPWQLLNQQRPELPLLVTEWGALPYNRYRGETGLVFAGEMERRDASGVFSFALATNEGMMGSALGPIDQFAFHTDPVRLATDRVAVLLLRRQGSGASSNWDRQGGNYRYQSSTGKIDVSGPNSDRRADFLGSLDREPLSSSQHLLLIRFGDAQNSGFSSRLIENQVVFQATNVGSMPVRELAVIGSYEVSTSRQLEAWALDAYTGARVRKERCTRTTPGKWRIDTSSINTEIVGH